MNVVAAPGLPDAVVARAWLRGAVAFWAEHGVDPGRGFHEHLCHDTLGCDAGFRRLRVLTRQIYVFSSPLGHDCPGASSALALGLDRLLGPARHPDGGFANRFDLDGRVIDGTRDLYDLAFVLFALAHAHDRLRDAALRDEARTLCDFLERRMAHPAGGYLESLPPRLPRRQNPHMHLLESAIMWADRDPSGPFTGLRDRLIALMAARFFDPNLVVLREYLADDVSPLPGPQGGLWEPGHHFEWVWLLTVASRQGAHVPEGLATSLMARARRDGLHDGAGAIWGELDAPGRVTNPNARIWALTEWVKAEAVTPGPDRAARVGRAWAALGRFLDVPVAGLWHERWDGARRAFVHEPSPATSLYHLAMAVHTMQDPFTP